MDGSERILTWVDVVPSTGASGGDDTGVGCGGGGRGVSEGTGVNVGGKVEVTTNDIEVGITVSFGRALQPVPRRKMIKIEGRSFLGTTIDLFSRDGKDIQRPVIENEPGGGQVEIIRDFVKIEHAIRRIVL